MSNMVSETGLSFFEARLRIDPRNLDKELMEQPEFFYHVGERAALERSRHQQLKDDLSVLEAKLYRTCAEEIESRGERVTDKAVLAAVAGSKKRKEAYTACLRQGEIASQWEILTSAVKQRSYEIRGLVDLTTAGLTGTSILASPGGGGARRWESESQAKPLINKRREEILEKRKKAMTKGKKG